MKKINLAQKILKGNKLAASQLISLCENQPHKAKAELKKLYPHTGQAHVVGITGSQGSGKSSVIDRLIEIALKEKQKIGVIAVDPTSQFSGGAFLGDRIRMQRHTLQKKVFIRSMATRSHRGGISLALHDTIRILDAYGCDLIFVESIGVGQDETEIFSTADTTLLILTPQSGDKIQAAKAGLLEACDGIIFNKSDLAEAHSTYAILEEFLHLPLFKVSAKKNRGFSSLYRQLKKDFTQSHLDGSLLKRREKNIKAEIRSKAEEALLQKFNSHWNSKSIQAKVEQSVQKKQDVDKIVSSLLKK